MEKDKFFQMYKMENKWEENLHSMSSSFVNAFSD